MNKEYLQQDRERLQDFVINPQQLAGIRRSVLEDGKARGIRVADVHNGSGLSYTVVLDKGMDIGAANYRGMALAHLSAPGMQHPAYFEHKELEWLRTWGGGLVTGCGLRHVGAPDSLDGEDFGLHGRVSNIPAEGIICSEEWVDGKYLLSVQGKVREARLYGENLLLTRKITTPMGENLIKIEDKIENQGFRPTQMMLLYHINLGYPLISPDSVIKAEEHQVVPRDDNAAQGFDRWFHCEEPDSTYIEQCFYHDLPADSEGMGRITMVNETLGIELEIAHRKAELPFLTQWKNMGKGEYVVGLEPANCHVEGITKEQNEFKSLKMLEPGEAVETLVEVRVKTS